MVVFHSYVSLPEGIPRVYPHVHQVLCVSSKRQVWNASRAEMSGPYPLALRLGDDTPIGALTIAMGYKLVNGHTKLWFMVVEIVSA